MAPSRRHRRTLVAIFAKPVPVSLRWAEVAAMLRALGAELEERAGSRVAVVWEGRIHVLHKPHPGPELKRGSVRSVRAILEAHGVRPEERE